MQDMSLWGCLLGNSSYRISSKLLSKEYFPFKSLPVQPWGLCFSETLRTCKLILLGLFCLGWLWCTFCGDSKRHPSYMTLSPCQISHPCSKVWRRASFLANYLQVIVIQPNQFISPPPYFLREPNLFIWTFKEGKSASGRHRTWKISAPTALVWQSYSQLTTALRGEAPDNPSVRQRFQLHLHAGQARTDIVSGPCPLPGSYF